jgi:xanthosine utilization system XapX-like protein
VPAWKSVLENEMSVKKTLGLPAGKLIAIAGLAGLLAGGAAIYVKESLSGNATGAVASADPAACPLAAAKAEAITPFSKGQVAAMRTVDARQSLGDLVRALPRGNAGAQRAAERPRLR